MLCNIHFELLIKLKNIPTVLSQGQSTNID